MYRLSDSDFLSNAFYIISNRSADIEQKIERLKEAKRDIEAEQDQAFIEIKQIEKPSLDLSWEGAEANKFDEDRREAYQVMKTKISNYDHYIYRIDWEISQLKLQQNTLDIASSIAYQADRLLDQGEEAVEAFGRKINELKGWLF
ncbi:YwqH-like family protein [Gracilibacillus lacisalsi]|uniref:YwqH-like family protein n=1 Tax=Gracilibacillus lacisalsi TaxID=393087 RepID=UPI003CCC383D